VVLFEGGEDSCWHDRLGDRQGLGVRERRLVVERPQAPGDAHTRRRSGLDVKVGAVEIGKHHQDSIEIAPVHGGHCMSTVHVLATGIYTYTSR
jgi:hypothetical protein